jgi:Short C-terminal domain
MGRRAQERQYAEADQDDRISSPEQNQGAAQAPAQPTGQAAGGSPPMLDQLAKLTTLRDQGALTDEEFATAKAKILAGG